MIKLEWIKKVIYITDEQQKLVTDNHNLIYRFLQKYHLTVDEYYDIAAIGLCKAAISFDSEKAQFSTYAFACMRSQVCKEIRKGKAVSVIPNDKIVYYQATMENNDGDSASFINFIPSKEHIEDDVLSKVLLDKCLNKLSDRDKKVYELLKKGYKQIEIGKVIGCSQVHVSRLKKKLAGYLVCLKEK